jgi:hypothetical protein
MRKDWEDRFADRPSVTKPKFTASAGNRGQLLGTHDRGIPCFAIFRSRHDRPGVHSNRRVDAAVEPIDVRGAADTDPLVSSLGMFVLLPLISGGLNAFLIFAALSAIQGRWHRKS